ncbi:SDR family NAD(P)-dependent oxidoreductase [Risungbinella massiliensis]|uniref:SDR family NAD(P)-dependent oxidoreductase n=1 Tax=Risungbinella massiliensis TaxID=1329796 RepID=UPI00069B06B2|nr:SDR family oxidoreductase [Risungbinella massiliensis]
MIQYKEVELPILSIVTGAAGELGQDVCRRLLDEGHNVLAILRPGGRKLREFNLPVPVTSIEIDFSNTPSLEDLKAAIESSVRLDRFKKINIVHTAGSFSKEKLPCSQSHLDMWQRMFNIHCVSLYGLVNVLLPYLSKIRQGCIVGVSSNLVSRVNMGTTAYIASKAALEATIKQLAYELGYLNIRCNCIAPGYFPSGLSEGLSKEKQNDLVNNTPLRRIATIEDIGNAILGLLSDHTGWVTGQIITVDGGNTIGF